MPKLYKVRTHGEMLTRPDRLVGYADITIHWFRNGRVEPAYPYTWTIPGWEEMVNSPNPNERNPDYAKRLSGYVDQLFTGPEATALREYFLRTRSTEVEIEEISVPLTSFEIPYSLIPPEPQAGENYGFVDLSDGHEGPVPFGVRGYFDVEYPSAFDRYQVSTVKSLLELSGVTLTDSSDRADISSLCEKLNTLRLALINLQQTLDTLSQKAERAGESQ